MTYPIQRLFLHFYDPHYMADDGSQAAEKERAEAEVATRLALLCADEVLVPAASYVENQACRRVIDSYSDIFADGAIRLVGGENSFRAYALSKQFQYDEGTARYKAYTDAANLSASAPGFMTRRRNTTADLHDAWGLGAGDAARMVSDLPPAEVKELSRRWSEVSDELGRRAFIPEYVVPMLGVAESSPVIEVVASRVRSFINKNYFGSFLREYQSGVVTDLVFLDAFAPDPDVITLPFKQLHRALASAKLLSRVMSADPAELRTLHEDADVARELLRVLADASSATMPTRFTLPISNISPDLSLLLKVRSGTEAAHIYAKRFQTVFEALFAHSTDTGSPEAEVNDGRKRIDILFPNMARSGAFGWAGTHYGARFVIVECKNYSGDPANPEYDQLGMRFGHGRGRFGILACRKIKNMELAISRCRDAHRDGHGLMVPLTDDDLEQLVDAGIDPGMAPLGDTLLGKRMLVVASG